MTRAEDICLTIADLMSQVSKKLYKLGQVVTKISENLATIEKYCEKNLRDTHCLSDIYNELKKSIFASCNQVRKPSSNYTNIFVPLCKATVSNFERIYDVRDSDPDAETEKRAQQV